MPKNLRAFIVEPSSLGVCDNSELDEFFSLFFRGLEKVTPLKVKDYSTLDEFIVAAQDKKVNLFFWNWMSQKGISKIKAIVNESELITKSKKLGYIIEYDIFMLSEYLESDIVDSIIDGLSETTEMVYSALSQLVNKYVVETFTESNVEAPLQNHQKEEYELKISSSDKTTGNFFKRSMIYEFQ